MEDIIKMSKKELDRIPVLEKALDKKIKNKEGARQTGLSLRQFRRLKKEYKINGVKALIHKSRGKVSNREIPQEEKDFVIEIVRKRFYDFGPTLAHEKLTEEGLIDFSVETLRKEMIKQGLYKNKKRKKADIHQPRERREQEGELIQADGSPHKWFEERGDKCVLLVFIDDATGKLLWLEFAESESTESYFRAMTNYLALHGKPLSIYVDKHSVFRVNTNNSKSSATTDSNGLTQFGRAMEELGIEMIYANSAQAKGRVERVNETLQDRLVKEMRLRGITNIEDGNIYVQEFMKLFNSKFAVEPKSKINAHRPLLKEDNLNEILSLKEKRVVSKNLTVQYKNKTYLIEVKDRYEYTMRGARVDVIETLDGKVQIRYKGKDLKLKINEICKSKKICNSKNLNKTVDKLKPRQGRSYQFNLLGRTFLLWTKPDISNLG